MEWGWVVAICEKHCVHAWSGDGGLKVVASLDGGRAFLISAFKGHSTHLFGPYVYIHTTV